MAKCSDLKNHKSRKATIIGSLHVSTAHTHIKVYLTDLPCHVYILSSPPSVKAVVYKWIVRPVLEYDSPVWCLHSMKDISQLEWWVCGSRWNSANCNWRAKSLETFAYKNLTGLHSIPEDPSFYQPDPWYSTQQSCHSIYQRFLIFHLLLFFHQHSLHVEHYSLSHSTVAELCCISDCLSLSI